MNILFLNSASRGFGGNEKSILLIADILSARHQVVLAYRKEDIGKHTTITKYRLPFLFEGDLYTISCLIGIVKKHQIDIIIPSKRKDYAIAGLVSRICKIKNILWLGALRRPKNTLSDRLVYSTLADGIIVNALQIKEGLLKSGMFEEENIKVLYRGIDTKALDLVSLPSEKKPNRTMQISAMGRLDKNKNHALLLRGFAKFLTMEPAAKTTLCIMGEGNERTKLELLIKELQLRNYVSMPGFKSNPYTYLAGSDVFVVTSESEGLSIALIEAIYLGNLPVSTYAGGGVRDIITNDKNGLLFNNGDETALAVILRKLYLEPEYRQQIAKAAKNTITNKYSNERVIYEMTEFCHKILDKNQS